MIMRGLAIAGIFVSLLVPAFAQGPSPSGAEPKAFISFQTQRALMPYQDLMQKIARKADPIDLEDLRQIEHRARAGSRDDELAMGCLLALGPAAQVTSTTVPQVDPVKAAQYFEMAARAGSPEAQFFLGLMNSAGEGIPLDRVSGAMWLNVARSSGFKPADKEAKRVDHDLSPNELAQARQRAQEWVSQHPAS